MKKSNSPFITVGGYLYLVETGEPVTSLPLLALRNVGIGGWERLERGGIFNF
jgi:hypothetical protein